MAGQQKNSRPIPMGYRYLTLLSSSHPLFLIYSFTHNLSDSWLWPGAKPRGGLRLALLGLILSKPQVPNYVTKEIMGYMPINDTTAAKCQQPIQQARSCEQKSEELVDEQEVSGSPPDDRIANLKAFSQHAGENGLKRA